METNNEIFILRPFRKYGTWVFNDEIRNLVEEPFVFGMPQIIDKMVGDRNVHEFTMIFSRNELPDYDLVLEKRTDRPETIGAWYQCEKLGMSGWLCPALNLYYRVPPDKIYIKIEKDH